MREDTPSRTAEAMALFRALEDARPRGARLFADPYARAFLRAPLKLVVSLSKIPGLLGPVRSFIDRRWPGALSSGVARTRFIDDRVCAALSDGVEQLILLGAGFDSRPYRLSGCERITVFEVDHPATLARRQQVLASLRGSCAWVRSVPIDFDRDRIETVLATAGYDADRPTLFLWEGVTNYLTESAIDHTLRWCASSRAAARIIFTYVHRGVLDDPGAFFGATRMLATFEALGERWTFGLDPSQLPEFLKARGLHLDEDVGATQYRARYFGAAAAAMRGYEFYRIACAHVADRPR